MKALFKSVIGSLMVLLFASCGSSSSGTSITVSLVPETGSTNVAVSASITATFSAAITEPSSWSSAFTVIKNVAGSETVCTGVTYSSSTRIATCTHADLDINSTYNVSVSGITDVGAVTASFTTITVPVGGTVTLQGTLSAASANIAAPKTISKAAVDVTGYKALIINNNTGEGKTATVAANGSFSMTATGGSSYTINFLDSNSDYVGTLKTGTAGTNIVSTGLVTGGDGTTSDLGTVTANTTTGLVASDQTLSSDPTALAYATDGVIAGGNTGAGSTDYSSSVGLSCTSASVTCPDLDHDGVPDVLDTDNNNDTYADQIDGLVDKCVSGATKLYIANYPTCTGATCAQMNFPTPTEIDANVGQLSMYTINLEFTPDAGSSVSDFDYIQVATPAYIDTYGYVYSDTSGEPCFNNVLWTTCNDKKLKNYASDPTKFKIQLAEPPAIGKGHILENMRAGDSFIFTIRKTDETTQTCTRKIGIIQKYYPYAVTRDGSALDTTDTITSWPTTSTLGWSLATEASGSRPKGMTYQVRVFPYSSSGGNCSFNAADAVVYASGQDITSAAINTSTLPSSSISMWGLHLYAIDTVGDETHVGPFSFTTAASKPCN